MEIANRDKMIDVLRLEIDRVRGGVLDQLQDIQSLALLFGAIILLGMLVGFLSTYRAVRKYLKLSLDELY